MEQIARHIRELEQALDQLPLDQIEQVISILHEARLKGKQVLVLGVGRSAPIALRFAGDLCKIPHRRGAPGFKAIGLTESAPGLSSSIDGEDVETLITNQIDNLLSRGDILLAFSLSGNSKIALRVIELANHKGAITIGFTGDDTGRMPSIVDINVRISTHRVEHVEDIHLVIQNIITQVLREEGIQTGSPVNSGLSLSQSNGGNYSSIKFKKLTQEQSVKIPTPEHSRTSVELFTELSRELAYESKLNDVLRRVLQLTLNKLHATSGTFVILNQTYEPVEGVMVFNGEAQPYTLHKYSDIIEHGLAGWVVRNRQGALISNTRDDPRWLSRTWDEEGSRVHSAICVPLLDNERVVGVLTLVAEQAGRFSEEDLSLLAAVTMFITLVNYAL